MMESPSLIPALVELGLKSATALREVQARQVIYGGDQQLNLLELKLVTEAQLLLALQKISHRKAAQEGPIPLDLELTAQLRSSGLDGVVGLLPDGSLQVSVGLGCETELTEIEAVMGRSCEVVITSNLRMEEALAMFTGDELPARLARVLDTLGPRLRLAPASRPPFEPDPDQVETVATQVPEVASSQPRSPGAGVAKDAETSNREQIQTSRGAAVGAPGDEPAHRPVTARALPLRPDIPAYAETAPPPIGYEDITAFSAVVSSRGALDAKERERNVYALQEAVEDLLSASNRDRILDILVHFSSTLFDYTAAFAIVGTELRGLRARGQGSPTETIKQLTIPLDLPSALKEAQLSPEGQQVQLRASGIEGGVARDLGRPVGIEVFLCPVVLQNRPVLLLWCDNGTKPVLAQSRHSFEQLLPQVATALRRVVLEKKRATRAPRPFDFAAPSVAPGSASSSAPAPPRPERTGAEPSNESTPVSGAATDPPATAPALGIESRPSQHDAVTVLSTAAEKSTPPPEANAHSSRPAPPRAILPAAGAAIPSATAAQARKSPSRSENPAKGSAELPSDSPTKTGLTEIVPRHLMTTEHESSEHTRRNPAAPPQGLAPERPLHEIAAAKKRTFARSSSGENDRRQDSEPPDSFPLDAPRTLKGFPNKLPGQQAPAQKLREVDPSLAAQLRAPLVSRRIVPVGKSLRPRYEAPAPETSHLKETKARSEKTKSDTLLSRRPALLEPDESGWDLPADRVSTPQGSSQKAASAGGRRPKSFTDLVAELLKGNDAVLPQLLDGGETAVGALIAEFPGPVREPESPSVKASECGPILAALVGLGSKSLPFVTVRTADENPRVRRWATFLLGELPGKESAKAIANRLLDSSVEVRRAALTSARRARRDPLTRRSLRAHIEQMCRDQSLDADARCSAMEALADIREHEAIPVLLQLMEDFSPNVARSARWALCVLTRQDFGDDTLAWQAFWQNHRDEDRVEWLISSLDHEQRDIRRAAGDELRALCGKDFGYDEDQAQSERRRAQADFRTWWNETGKANLH